MPKVNPVRKFRKDFKLLPNNSPLFSNFALTDRAFSNGVKPNSKTEKTLLDIYKRLYQHFGPRHWWPAKTPFEVIVGAILTQNTAWQNVEKAIANLKEENLLFINKMLKLPHKKLARLIKPSGYYNQKAKKLKDMVIFLKNHYQAKLSNMRSIETKTLREQLLGIKGVGPETADSILLYALNRPIFVVDAYTKRIFERLKLIKPSDDYHQIQSLFMNNLAPDVDLFNEYHALIVELGKRICNRRPLCSQCVLSKICESYISLGSKINIPNGNGG